MNYWHNGELITKSKELDDLYKKLSRRIKKHVPYQWFEWKGYKRKESISDSLLVMLKEGKIDRIF